MTYIYHCSGWTVILVGAPLAFLVTVLSYYVVEKRILEFKNRFASGTLLQEATLNAGSEK